MLRSPYRHFSLLILLLPVTVLPAIGQKKPTAPVPASLPANGLLPAGAKPNATVLERDLTGVTIRLIKKLHNRQGRPFLADNPTASVTHIQVLTALTRAALNDETQTQYRTNPPQDLPPDGGQLSASERIVVGTAIAEGWLRTERPLHKKQIATWAYVQGILRRIEMGTASEEKTETAAKPPTPKSEEESGEPAEVNGPPVSAALPKEVSVPEDAFTGLAIEAGELKFERSMSPRILDEDGKVLYPEAGHAPDVDFALDYGSMSYEKEVAKSTRVGKRPLVIQALKNAPNCSDIIVSNADAERIRQAHLKSKFLWRWAVALVEGGQKKIEKNLARTDTTENPAKEEKKEEKEDKPN